VVVEFDDGDLAGPRRRRSGCALARATQGDGGEAERGGGEEIAT
jgi:hypothetical protein